MHSSSPSPPVRLFGMRDAWAYARAMPRLAGMQRPKMKFTALARISAMNVRDLPAMRRFTASDGASLAYRTYAGPADRHLVLVHGSACFGDQFNYLASHLASSGKATVHTLDMRGHGQSPPIGRDHERFARDVGEFAAHLKDLPGNPTIVVGGHSAGGGLVVNVARSVYAATVSGWLLFAPFLRVDSDTLRPYFGGWLSEVRRVPLAAIAFANMLGITRFNDRIVAAFDREACIHDPRFVREWSFASAFGFGPGPIPDRVHKRISSDTPVLLLSGRRDECFIAEKYAAALAPIAPHGEVRLFDGLGHWDTLVDENVLAACGQWLDEHFARSAPDTATQPESAPARVAAAR